jgi:hypothetical protein
MQAELASRDLPGAALLIRELLLFQGDNTDIRSTVNSSIHSRYGSSTTSTLLDTARIAYFFGDDADAKSAYTRLTVGAQVAHTTSNAKKKPTPTPTPRPAAQTMNKVLTKGITKIKGTVDAVGSTFQWPEISGASQYVVIVTASDGTFVWSWAGSAHSEVFGDTSIAGASGTADDGWTASLPGGYHWTVLALDASGKIVGLKLR